MTLYFAWKFCSRSFLSNFRQSAPIFISYYIRQPIVNRINIISIRLYRIHEFDRNSWIITITHAVLCMEHIMIHKNTLISFEWMLNRPFSKLLSKVRAFWFLYSFSYFAIYFVYSANFRTSSVLFIFYHDNNRKHFILRFLTKLTVLFSHHITSNNNIKSLLSEFV